MTVTERRHTRIRQYAVELPQPSQVYYVGREASVQFALNPFNFRVGRVRPIDERSIWIWVDGYELGPTGDAVARRSIFVMRTGLRPPVVIASQRRRRSETTTCHDHSGGGRPDDGGREEFVGYIKAEIQSLADEIADLAATRGGALEVGEADRLIAIHRRTIGRLRVHLPSIPKGT